MFECFLITPVLLTVVLLCLQNHYLLLAYYLLSICITYTTYITYIFCILLNSPKAFSVFSETWIWMACVPHKYSGHITDSAQLFTHLACFKAVWCYHYYQFFVISLYVLLSLLTLPMLIVLHVLPILLITAYITNIAYVHSILTHIYIEVEFMLSMLYPMTYMIKAHLFNNILWF